MVLTSGNVIILPAALDCAASSAPFGSAAKILIDGLMALAANATPDVIPPPAVFILLKNREEDTRIYANFKIFG
jgi:hypothetical protein